MVALQDGDVTHPLQVAKYGDLRGMELTSTIMDDVLTRSTRRVNIDLSKNQIRVIEEWAPKICVEDRDGDQDWSG